MSQMIENIQYRLKTSSTSILIFGLKAVSGLLLGLTLALILEVILGYGTFSFLLVITVVTAVFLRISKGWSLMHILIFDLVCVLVALLLRMYILIAPGA